MVILRTTLSDIRTWQKIVFPSRTPSMRSKSAISIPYKSNRRLLRDQRRDDKQSCQSPGQGRAAKSQERRSSRKLVIGLPTIGNFRFTETEIQNNQTSAGILFPLSAPISPPFFAVNLHNFTFSLATRGSEERRTTARVLNNRRHVTHVTWCCGTIVDLVCVRDFGDRTVRKAPRIEMIDDREKVFSSINQRAYVSDQSYLYLVLQIQKLFFSPPLFVHT